MSFPQIPSKKKKKVTTLNDITSDAQWERIFTSRKRTLLQKARDLEISTGSWITVTIRSHFGDTWFYASTDALRDCLQESGVLNGNAMRVTGDSLCKGRLLSELQKKMQQEISSERESDNENNEASSNTQATDDSSFENVVSTQTMTEHQHEMPMNTSVTCSACHSKLPQEHGSNSVPERVKVTPEVDKMIDPSRLLKRLSSRQNETASERTAANLHSSNQHENESKGSDNLPKNIAAAKSSKKPLQKNKSKNITPNGKALNQKGDKKANQKQNAPTTSSKSRQQNSNQQKMTNSNKTNVAQNGKALNQKGDKIATKEQNTTTTSPKSRQQNSNQQKTGNVNKTKISQKGDEKANQEQNTPTTYSKSKQQNCNQQKITNINKAKKSTATVPANNSKRDKRLSESNADNNSRPLSCEANKDRNRRKSLPGDMSSSAVNTTSANKNRSSLVFAKAPTFQHPNYSFYTDQDLEKEAESTKSGTTVPPVPQIPRISSVGNHKIFDSSDSSSDSSDNEDSSDSDSSDEDAMSTSSSSSASSNSSKNEHTLQTQTTVTTVRVEVAHVQRKEHVTHRTLTRKKSVPSENPRNVENKKPTENSARQPKTKVPKIDFKTNTKVKSAVVDKNQKRTPKQTLPKVPSAPILVGTVPDMSAVKFEKNEYNCFPVKGSQKRPDSVNSDVAASPKPLSKIELKLQNMANNLPICGDSTCNSNTPNRAGGRLPSLHEQADSNNNTKSKVDGKTQTTPVRKTLLPTPLLPTPISAGNTANMPVVKQEKNEEFPVKQPCKRPNTRNSDTGTASSAPKMPKIEGNQQNHHSNHEGHSISRFCWVRKGYVPPRHIPPIRPLLPQNHSFPVHSTSCRGRDKQKQSTREHIQSCYEGVSQFSEGRDRGIRPYDHRYHHGLYDDNQLNNYPGMQPTRNEQKGKHRHWKKRKPRQKAVARVKPFSQGRGSNT